MCKRRENPYKGLSNFVGGKIEEHESGLDAAYRELEENELYWSTPDLDFFDVTQYAGEGNIGHIMMQIEMFQKELGLACF